MSGGRLWGCTGSGRAGQGRSGPACGQAPMPAAKLPSVSENGAGQEGAGGKTVCLTLEPTAVWFQLSTKMSLVTRLPYLLKLV